MEIIQKENVLEAPRTLWNIRSRRLFLIPAGEDIFKTDLTRLGDRTETGLSLPG